MHSPGTTPIFVTGTDTGVGKTIIAAALASLLREHGFDAAPMKPIQTGAFINGDNRKSTDLDFCLAVNNLDPDPGVYRWMLPVALPRECSPHLAARAQHTAISPETITNALDKLCGIYDPVVIEGAGGLLVPLNSRHTMLDLIKRTGA